MHKNPKLWIQDWIWTTLLRTAQTSYDLLFIMNFGADVGYNFYEVHKVCFFFLFVF